MRPALLPEASRRFRDRIVDAVEASAPGSFGFKTADSFDARCPVCDGILVVVFHGRAPRCDVFCHRGCTEAQVADALNRLIPGATA
jgi:hypothetical protein